MTFFRRLIAIGALVGAGIGGPTLAADKNSAEHALLQRLFAPCCYRETLDIHTSALAGELRMEIHRRLDQGESENAIIQDLTLRYESRSLTRPPGLWMAAGMFWGAAALSAVLITLALRTSRRTRDSDEHSPRPTASATSEGTALDDELTDELADLD